MTHDELIAEIKRKDEALRNVLDWHEVNLSPASRWIVEQALKPLKPPKRKVRIARCEVELLPGWEMDKLVMCRAPGAGYSLEAHWTYTDEEREV